MKHKRYGEVNWKRGLITREVYRRMCEMRERRYVKEN